MLADEPDYAAADKDLKVVKIDGDPKESFLGIAVDTDGRLFVGGREALFVYEVDDKSETGYGPRKEIYRFPADTWIYDIAIRGKDLYVLTVAALYVIPDAVVESRAEHAHEDKGVPPKSRYGLKAKRLVWGVPLGHVHQCFHGMAIGPEGDIYFAMGDPLWYYGDFNRPDHFGHWSFFFGPKDNAAKKEEKPDAGDDDEQPAAAIYDDGETTWQKTPYTGVGGVFRVRPDGSGFQVVATGLRNPCGLCFDRTFNLFTNDNDHEGLPGSYVPGRLLHVTPHAWFGWPRGWMRSKTPDRADLLEDMYGGLGRAVPVGMCYYDEEFLPQFRNQLLVARWCIRAITRYPIEPHGATFKSSTEEKLLIGQNNARPVHVAVGRGGRIFASIAFMAHNEGSPVYSSDLVMITKKDDAPPYGFEGYDRTTADFDRLWKEISCHSWHRRNAAHSEIVRNLVEDTKAEDTLDASTQDSILAIIASRDASHPAMPHLIHTTGIRPKGEFESSLVQDGFGQTPFEREHVAKAYRDARWSSSQFRRATFESVPGKGLFASLLNSEELRTRHAALTCLFNYSEQFPHILVANSCRSDDSHLRQTACMLLAQTDVPSLDIEKLCRADDVPGRLAGVLAAGFRLTLPPATGEIPEEVPLVEPRGPVVPFDDGEVDLRKLGRIGNFTMADYWKAVKRSEEQEALFALLVKMLKDKDEQVRLQAAHFLYVLNDPRSEPLIEDVRKKYDERRLETAAVFVVPRVWAVGPFDDAGKGFETVHGPEKGAVDLTAEYPSPQPSPKGRGGEEGIGTKMRWKELATDRLYDFQKEYGHCDGKSFYAYFQLDSAAKQRIILMAGSDDGLRIWHNGKLVHDNDATRGALPFQDEISIVLEPGSNDILARVRNRDGTCGLYLHYKALQPVEVTLPEKLALETLSQRLKSAEGPVKYGPEFFDVDWEAEIKKGDVEQGKKLFTSLSCVKCHAIDASSTTTGGPSLAEAAKRFTVPYVVQSVLLPNAQVSPVFKATAVQTKDGLQVSGLIVGETADSIELLLPDASKKTIAKSHIEAKQLQDLSPMPAGVIKKPGELRDILAFLLQQDREE